MHKKFENHRNLKKTIKSQERRKAEATLRSLNLYSRRTSEEDDNSKKVFPLDDLEAARKAQG